MVIRKRLKKESVFCSVLNCNFHLKILILLFITGVNSFAQNSNENSFLKESNKSPVVIPPVRIDSAGKTDTGPGQYTPAQDSAFKQALKLNLPFNALIQNGLHLSEPIWEFEHKMSTDKQFSIAARHLNSLPKSYYLPTPVELVQRQIMIENAFNVPFVKTYNPYGLKVNLSDIGQFLGLIEDVSPRITYSLEYTTDVEIVVYSVKATVIATIFKGVQPPGKYDITWNGRDDIGKMMESGDYVAEVRIGKEKFIRKRIVIP